MKIKASSTCKVVASAAMQDIKEQAILTGDMLNGRSQESN